MHSDLRAIKKYITSTGSSTDDLYHSRTVDDETEDIWTEMDLSNSEVQHRLLLEHKRTEVDKLETNTSATHTTGVTE